MNKYESPVMTIIVMDGDAYARAKDIINWLQGLLNTKGISLILAGLIELQIAAFNELIELSEI